jgi:hypothetical protein
MADSETSATHGLIMTEKLITQVHIIFSSVQLVMECILDMLRAMHDQSETFALQFIIAAFEKVKFLLARGCIRNCGKIF